MGKLIEGIALGSKEKIWNDRCNQINKLEKYTNNKKVRKKWENNKKEKQKKKEIEKNKRTNSEIESEEKLLQMAKNKVNKNNKNLMSKVIADRYIEHLITNKDKVQKIWSTTHGWRQYFAKFQAGSMRCNFAKFQKQLPFN
ncbi:hypothetical protein C1645_740960 [Glomus cerebriforme]|uniref:Uncharacterized protein n=1 Tax=Glomus cerebriforme TaxID=658196 RepID=A0A397SJ87_9GLOM|nr:hypothetical protein C1645_740960 [Glomus cerebriforme]